jgi:hypothetical protein
MNRSLILILALIVTTTALPGCGLFGRRAVEQPQVDQLAATPYPKDAPLGRDLDIVVVREGWRIRLVNREPHTYGDMLLWLNEQYVGQVKQVVIGTDNMMPLSAFINHHRERFPVGGFLDPEKTSPVVLAELYDPATGQRHRLNARVLTQDAVIGELPGVEIE